MEKTLEYRVGVFEHQRKRSILVTAYVTYFNPSWSGCCLHIVRAESGQLAKKIAIAGHKELCMEVK